MQLFESTVSEHVIDNEPLIPTFSLNPINRGADCDARLMIAQYIVESAGGAEPSKEEIEAVTVFKLEDTVA